MKNNNSTFIVLGGIFILSVFSFIVAKNILPDSDNNQYYAKPNENMIAKIESITKENNKLIITTTGDPKYYLWIKDSDNRISGRTTIEKE